MDFYTQFVRPDQDDHNPGGGEIITESAGYVPAEKMIIDMINAGVRLQAFRENYDYGADEEIDLNDVRVDPTRDGDYDAGDALRDIKVAEAAYIEAKKVLDDLKAKSDDKKVDVKSDVDKVKVEE